jgi:hypothetical protein
MALTGLKEKQNINTPREKKDSRKDCGTKHQQEKLLSMKS